MLFRSYRSGLTVRRYPVAIGRPRRMSRTFSAEWLGSVDRTAIGPSGRPGACRADVMAIQPLYGRGSRLRSWWLAPSRLVAIPLENGRKTGLRWASTSLERERIGRGDPRQRAGTEAESRRGRSGANGSRETPARNASRGAEYGLPEALRYQGAPPEEHGSERGREARAPRANSGGTTSPRPDTGSRVFVFPGRARKEER